jgi:hypothetical protein
MYGTRGEYVDFVSVRTKRQVVGRVASKEEYVVHSIEHYSTEAVLCSPLSHFLFGNFFGLHSICIFFLLHVSY